MYTPPLNNITLSGIPPVTLVNGTRSAPSCSLNPNQLFLSNQYETFTTLGKLHGDTVNTPFRLFAWHVNKTGSTAYINLQFVNTTGSQLTITTTRHYAFTNYYVGSDQGARLFANWYKSSGNTTLCTAPPNGTAIVNLASVANTYLFGAMYDIPMSGASSVTVNLYAAHSPSSIYTSNRVSGSGGVCGTFPYCNCTFTWNHSVSGNAGSYNAIDIALRHSNPSASIGEYSPGYDAVTGGQVWNDGQYGALYTCTFNLTNSNSHYSKLDSLVINPPGGSSSSCPDGYVAIVDSLVGTSPTTFGPLNQTYCSCYDNPVLRLSQYGDIHH